MTYYSKVLLLSGTTYKMNIGESLLPLGKLATGNALSCEALDHIVPTIVIHKTQHTPQHFFFFPRVLVVVPTPEVQEPSW